MGAVDRVYGCVGLGSDIPIVVEVLVVECLIDRILVFALNPLPCASSSYGRLLRFIQITLASFADIDRPLQNNNGLKPNVRA